ncbi:uncharacterized protein LTR77_002680 [Saxophila tyrrhenica]|uniref:Apc15p protein-domain-containing protein n=1 Tax=Saxophila tyrrhenica TaxID=1690608 RepID=A0AAV9PJR6_9PEZI|nr:hypothetical protein LTR77_002680 [Saxophila tyrrhenica]
MLSLPLLLPQPDILPGRLNLRPRSPSPPQHGRHNQQGHRQHHQQSRRDEEKRNANPRTNPLALLVADEAAIQARKHAIRNFGSYWIRPPGIPKTLQAMNEEAADLAEHEEMMRQEQGLRDMQAQQQAEEARARAEAGEEEGEGEEERDLDEDIPDADADVEEESEEEEEEEEESGLGGEVTSFNEESIVEGSRVMDEQQARRFAEREEAELTGAARDEEDLGIEMERDLDDSVPEAGSYQHTDTEVEDSTSDGDLDDDDSPLGDSVGAAARQQRQLQQAQQQQQQIPSSSARRPGTRSSVRSQFTQSNHHQQPQRGRLPFEALDHATITPANGSGNVSMQDRLRAAPSLDASLTRSPGSLNLSSSMVESSFVSSSPVMQRGARGRGGRREG